MTLYYVFFYSFRKNAWLMLTALRWSYDSKRERGREIPDSLARLDLPEWLRVRCSLSLWQCGTLASPQHSKFLLTNIYGDKKFTAIFFFFFECWKKYICHGKRNCFFDSNYLIKWQSLLMADNILSLRSKCCTYASFESSPAVRDVVGWINALSTKTKWLTMFIRHNVPLYSQHQYNNKAYNSFVLLPNMRPNQTPGSVQFLTRLQLPLQ